MTVATSLTLTKTYGRDNAGIEYWYLTDGAAVRRRFRLTRTHRQAGAENCSSCANSQSKDYKWLPWHDLPYLVQIATGARSCYDGPTFVTLFQHNSFECAEQHLRSVSHVRLD